MKNKIKSNKNKSNKVKKEIKNMKKENKKLMTIEEIEKNYGGKVTSVEGSYIIVSNDDWDNDLVLYIEAMDASHTEYNRYQVVEAN